MRARAEGCAVAGNRPPREVGERPFDLASEHFGCHVFHRGVMQEMLPKALFQHVEAAMVGEGKIDPAHADAIALAMKEWAVGLGATHYTHWFQPLTGSTAEKHEAFIDWSEPTEVVEKFSGAQLVQGEPDASSFPSGGLRTTYEARGYTGWDPTSPVFIWKAGDGVTLCIPSVFFSWDGSVLDTKIPLLRSDRKIEEATLRLLKMTGVEAERVYSTIGLEQEYFVIDRALRNLRPDLVIAGRTVLGAAPAKGQELQDHYFGTVKDRMLNFMCDFEEAALRLGIPVKTRHNEVAPSQFEIAPNFERSTTAVDHNLLLMELMRQIAVKHDLACLLHEKPFDGLNGSGKHCNWSLATDTGINLLDPTKTPEHTLHFLILLTAILEAVHRHAVLLRASIGSAGNDHRLGGHEAPPAILSVYLGHELERLLENIEHEREHKIAEEHGMYDLGIDSLPNLTKDTTDRNRTSPFAFTGNKFELRALGSAASPALFVTVMNVIVAETLTEMLDAIDKQPEEKSLLDRCMEVVRGSLKRSEAVRFTGDNYSVEWVAEAEKRGLSNIRHSVEAFSSLRGGKTVALFEGVLTSEELTSRAEILTETYCHTIQIEAKLLLDLTKTGVVPAAVAMQKEWAKAIQVTESLLPSKEILKAQQEHLVRLSEWIEEAIVSCRALETSLKEAQEAPPHAKGKHFSLGVLVCCEQVRTIADQLETVVEDGRWPFPKYRELLFMN